MTSPLFFGKNIWNFFFFFLEMRTSMFLKHFKHKTKNIKHKTKFYFFLMTWLDKWQQGRTHIRHILFKFLPNLCYIKKIKVIKFGDKIFNRTKVINKNLEGEVKLPPPKKNRVKAPNNQYLFENLKWYLFSREMHDAWFFWWRGCGRSSRGTCQNQVKCYHLKQSR